MRCWKGSELERKDTKVAKVAKMQIREERTHGRGAVAGIRKQLARERWQGRKQSLLYLFKKTDCSVVSKGRQQQLVRH